MVRIDNNPDVFKMLVDTLLGSGSPMVEALMANDVNTHRKLRGRLKKGHISDLEYEDPNDSSKSIKLTDDEVIEILAIQSFLDYSQIQLGPKNKHRLDWSMLTRDDFEHYLVDFDEDQPGVYDEDMATRFYERRLTLLL